MSQRQPFSKVSRLKTQTAYLKLLDALIFNVRMCGLHSDLQTDKRLHRHHELKALHHGALVILISHRLSQLIDIAIGVTWASEIQLGPVPGFRERQQAIERVRGWRARLET